MKNLNLKLAGVLIFSLLSISTFAQNWLVDGNTNAQLGGSLTPSIGTNQNRPLLFETNGVERMRITPAGFVGIGTNNPFAPLQIHSPFAGIIQYTNSGTTAGSGRGFFVGNLSTTAYLWQAENAPLIFGTSATERMRITPTGYVGIGRNFTNPVADLHLHSTQTFGFLTSLKITNGTTGTTSSDGISLLNVGTVAALVNYENEDFLFYTGNSSLTLEHIRLVGKGTLKGFTQIKKLTPVTTTITGLLAHDADGTVLSSTGANGQFLTWNNGPEWNTPSFPVLCTTGVATNRHVYWTGTDLCQSIVFEDVPDLQIGINTTSPQSTLHVNGGDIRVSPINSGYMIMNNYVLRHRGNQTDIFVGVGAGNNNSGNNNTFVGSNAGTSNTSGGVNTFIGRNAGFSNNIESANTFIGSGAGQTNLQGHSNTFCGELAGRDNVSGDENAYFGHDAGFQITNGSWNAFFGAHAGDVGTSGSENTLVGGLAGRNNNGDGNIIIGYESCLTCSTNTLNTIVGYQADVLFDGYNNATAIGSEAITTGDDIMILGNNDVHVGIGLSGVTTPPSTSTKLEINGVNGNGTDDIDATPGASGLRFRDLTTNSTALTVNPFTVPAVLTVDAEGDVVLVEDQSGGAGGGDYDWLRTSDDLPPTDPNDDDVPAYRDGQTAIGTNTHATKDVATNSPIVAGTSARLNVFRNGNTIAGNFESLSSGDMVVGVRGYAASAANAFSAGVLGENPGLAKNNNYAGAFVGDVVATGTSTMSGWSWPSDITLKKDTTLFSHGLNIVRLIRPLSFRYNGVAGFDTTEFHTGVNAVELQAILPGAVSVFNLPANPGDSIGTQFLATKSDAILYTAINAIKELDSATTFLSSPPEAPQLLAPSNGDVVVDTASTSRFVWSSVKGAVLYHFQSALDSVFSPLNLLNDFVGSDTISPMFVIRDTMTIYWRVRSKNGFGESPWSPTGYFTLISTVKTLPADSSRQQEPQGRLSDATLKQNVTPLVNSLANLQQLEGVTFTWDTLNNPSLPSAQQIGMIAQQVQQYYPEVVFIDDSGYYRLDYERLVPVVVEAIKEQQNIIASQSLEIDSLKSAIAVIQQGGSDSLAATVDTLRQQMVFITNCLANHPGFCNNAKMGGGGNDGHKGNTGNKGIGENQNPETVTHVELASQSAILYQNQPNPFGEGTTIRYFLDDGVKEAFMIFTDMYGRELKKIELTARGFGAIEAATKELASGVYTYSLIMEGRVADTKRMERIK